MAAPDMTPGTQGYSALCPCPSVGLFTMVSSLLVPLSTVIVDALPTLAGLGVLCHFHESHNCSPGLPASSLFLLQPPDTRVTFRDLRTDHVTLLLKSPPL